MRVVLQNTYYCGLTHNIAILVLFADYHTHMQDNISDMSDKRGEKTEKGR